MNIFIDIAPFIGLMGLGAIAGLLAGLLGVGGGIILVPSLYVIFTLVYPNFDVAHLMHMSVGTSLAIIVPTGMSSAFAHYKRGNIDFDLVYNIGIGIFIGVILAVFVVGIINGQYLKMIFACVIIVLAGLMICDLYLVKSNNRKLSKAVTYMAGFIIGLISALAGIGGATLSVPYMSLHNIPMHRAVGSASMLGIIIALPAAVGFIMIGWGQDGLPPFSIGYVNILVWVVVMIVSAFFAPIGASMADKCSVKNLKSIFCILMILVAINMWQGIV